MRSNSSADAAVFRHLAERFHVEIRNFFDTLSVAAFVPAIYRERDRTHFASVRRFFKYDIARDVPFENDRI